MTLGRAEKRFVGFDFFPVSCFNHAVFLISLPDSFLSSRISSCFCHFTFSFICLCQYSNYPGHHFPFTLAALRAAVNLRHSCWGLGRNRSRGWELDAAPGRPFAYHTVGSASTFFSFPFLSPLSSTHWLWELVCGRPRRGRIFALDWNAPRRIRPSGMAWSLSLWAPFAETRTPASFPLSSRGGREDRYPGRMFFATTRKSNPFPPNPTGSLAPARPLTTPQLAPH
jgi:hypothetical protein